MAIMPPNVFPAPGLSPNWGNLSYSSLTKYPKYCVKKITLSLTNFQWLSIAQGVLPLLAESSSSRGLRILVDEQESQGLDGNIVG